MRSPERRHAIRLVPPVLALISVLFLCAALLWPRLDGRTGRIELEARALSGGPPAADDSPEVIDFRYTPREWQVCIGFPDDPHKTMVRSDGSLCYDYSEGGYFDGYDICLAASMETTGERGVPYYYLFKSRFPAQISGDEDRKPVEDKGLCLAQRRSDAGWERRLLYL